MTYYERQLKKQGYNCIIGVDEAGRGPLAGPVVAAAAVLNTFHFENRIDDSKKLTSVQREKAYREIIENSVFGLGIVSEKIIDAVNILEATRKAMAEAVSSLMKKLSPTPEKRIHILVDGNFPVDSGFPCIAIVKGDSKSISIAASSILAKVTRDGIMLEYDKVYPQYRFAKHKGYPTKEHRDILRKLGPTLIHRESFSYV
ncbi:MAG: ribonuclease HII [Candidatus Omnitrophica bacterium]|nr:ribonuclease HII [Candidatus Omnitrophota bacterium]MBU1869881.1 ribonuclease HII [Candidatus Omnitrophota bacterium]